ncbi:MAG TPA: universal stress protein [Dissulfurispiraceae bacterium]
MEKVRRILCVCRMPETCQKTVEYGASLSRKFGAELYVMHVIHNPFGLEGWNLPVPRGFIEEEYKKLLDDTKRSLDELIRTQKEKGLEIKEIIREGNPTNEVLKVADREHIDLLIMSGHQEGRLEHFLFGHSNEELLRKMPCSILMVKNEPGPVDF